MVAPADITGTRPLAHIEAPTPAKSVVDARQEIFSRLNQIELGKQLQAVILSRAADGTFLVKVADTVARMNLPAGARAGDALEMTFLSREPRPTFLLGSQTNGTTVTLDAVEPLTENVLQTSQGSALSAGAAGKAAALAASVAIGESQQGEPALASGATATLSNTGRLIDGLLQAALQDGTSAAIVGRTPLLASGTAAPAQIAGALHEALSSSGVFYEAHLAQWANHERPLADLMREPQAGHATAPGAKAYAGTDTSALLDRLRTSPALGGSTLPTDLARIVNLQLNALEQQRVAWQGELWPGQHMNWEVRREQSEQGRADHGDDGDPPSSWQSVVRFELPTLGVVAATIHVNGERVQVQVRTATAIAASSLRAHGSELAAALDAAGSQLDSLTVKQDEKI